MYLRSGKLSLIVQFHHCLSVVSCRIKEISSLKRKCFSIFVVYLLIDAMAYFDQNSQELDLDLFESKLALQITAVFHPQFSAIQKTPQ